MLRYFEPYPRPDVQETEYLRLLGFPPGHALDERPRQLAEWARAWYAEHGRPWIFFRRAGRLEIQGDGLRFLDIRFASPVLRTMFLEAEANDAMLVAVGAGPECEARARQCWEEGRPDEYFFLEMFGSAVVEQLVTQAAGRICAWADGCGLAVLPHYSPGYPGWPVTDQSEFWKLIRGEELPTFPTPLEVLDTGMLRPKKSLLALFGLTPHLEKVRPGSRLIPCENCSLAGCTYRRGPYRQFMPQAEVFDRTSVRPAAESARVTLDSPVLDRSASYRVSSRALAKWAEERLRLETAS